MTSPRFILGLDPHPDHCRVVRVRVDSIRPEVVEAVTVDRFNPLNPDFCRDTEAAVIVPDHQVIVKYLTLPEQGTDIRDRALFELAQSLTGPEKDYLLDTLPTGLDRLNLGLAVRRDQLAAIMSLPYKEISSEVEPTAALPRSLALAYGYLSYCVPASGNLVVLLDIAFPEASIAFVHNRAVVALMNLPTASIDFTNPPECERFTIELKTIVNFRLATLFGHGLTFSPAALVLSGDHTAALQHTLEKYFSMPIVPPEINTGFLGDHLRQEPAPMHRFLAPLGLTAKSLAQ